MANYVKFKQGLKKDFNTTNQPLTNGMIYFVIDENNHGSIYYDTVVDGKEATKQGAVHRVKFAGLPINITGAVIGNGSISDDGELITINTTTNHSHGLAHMNFAVVLSDDDTNLKWTRLGNQNKEGFWLKSIRGQSKAPAWFQPDFSAGIAFGGADTKGIISLRYQNPSIRFAGGNGDAPVWYFTITGANNATYDLTKIGGHSSDAAKLDHNIVFKIDPVADAIKGGNGITTNLSDKEIKLVLPASISGFSLLQATHFQGNADTATVAAKLGNSGNTSDPMIFNWSEKSGQPSYIWGGNSKENMYIYNPSNFKVNHAVSATGLDHNVIFKISKVANGITGENGIITKLDKDESITLILPSSLSGFDNIASTRFQGNADSATKASYAQALYLNPSSRQASLDYPLGNNSAYQNRVTYSLSTSTNKVSMPPIGDSHILTFGWDTTAGWGAQLALYAGAGPHMAIRGAKAGDNGASVWDTSWNIILDSSNYTSYINNYYWANIKVSTSSKEDTNPIFAMAKASNWFVSIGSTGWQNGTHGGGIYMTDKDYVRVFGGKKFYVANTEVDALYTSGGVRGDKGYSSDEGTMRVYAEYNNEINFGGTNKSSIIYFSYRAKDLKPITSLFIFGGSSGSATIQANAGWFGNSYISGNNGIEWYATKGSTNSKRYGYIQTDTSDNGVMHFVKENGGYFSYNSHLVPNKTNSYDLGTQALAWNTIYVNNINLYGQNANRLVFTNENNALQASHHYASTTQVSIGSTSPSGDYTFYVFGDSHLNGNVRVAKDIYMTGAGTSIYWDSDTYRQRLLTTDDADSNTPVFTFQQSENSATSWKNLLIIRDNGIIELLSNSGAIYKNFTSSNQNPVIWMNGNDTDNWLWQISSGTGTKQYYGYGLKYIGTGAGINNLLRLYADNQNNTDKIAIGINQNGQVGIGTDASTNHSLNVFGTGYFSDTLYAMQIGILNTAPSTGKGISLYGGGYGGIGTLPTYGIAYASTKLFGIHGAVIGDCATYFTMDAATNHGWIFKAGNTTVSSINNKGYAAFNAIGRETFISVPEGGDYRSKSDSVKGYLKITLPQYRSNTMISFKVSIYNYVTGTSCEYTIHGYSYQNGVWHNCTAYSSGYNGNLTFSNLPIYFGDDGSKNAIYLGDVSTSWSYPQIQVHDVVLGFNNNKYEKWCNEWQIDFVSALGTITATVSNPNSSYASTKLLNSRVIWGQAFDGTADIQGQLSNATRIMNRSTQPLYLGNSDNTNWVYVQDIASHSGSNKWAININGISWFQYANIGYTYSENDSAYKLRVNGKSYLNGDLNIPNSAAFYGILGQNDSTTTSNVGGLTWFNKEGTAGAAADINDTPTDSWWYILRNRHTNILNDYYTDVAIPFNSTSIYYKIVRNGAVYGSKWIKVLDIENYATELDGRYVLKTGDTMTGHLRIKATNTSERFVDVYNSTGHIYLDAADGRMGIWTNVGGVSTWLISTTQNTAEIPRLLSLSSNGNTVTIGSQNSAFCHIYNSTDVPFIFNKTVASTDGDLGTTTYPWKAVYSKNWFRSIGDTGWYSETYKGGWYMTDAIWMRSYNDKPIYTQGGIWSPHGHIFIVSNNEFNFIPDKYNNYVWFNYQSWSRDNSSTITEYKFGNGKGGLVDKVSANTFVGSLSGTAENAKKLTTTNVGSSTKPVYFSNGIPVQCNDTLGNSISGNAATATLASSANKLNTSAGGNTNPIYFANGIPVSSTASIGSANQPVYLKNGIITACDGSQSGAETYKSFVFNGSEGTPHWHCLGTLVSAGDSTSTIIDVYTGNGWNGDRTQNTHIGIFIKDGSQSTQSATSAFGASVLIYDSDVNATDIRVQCRASAHDTVTVYVYLPWAYGSGYYSIKGRYKSWTHINTTSTSAPTSGTAQDCYLGTFRADKVYGAVWNDYAEYRQTKKYIQPGHCAIETGKGDLVKSFERLQPGANIVSDTFGFAIGETTKTKTPLAVSGRVLAYTYEDRDSYQAGDPVCSGPNGTISKMTREEVREYPDRIIGTVSEIPDYEVWGSGNVKVDGRIWIKVK